MELTQTAFREGKLAEEATWQAMVMIPKGKGEYRGIGLVEVVWKILTLILHRRLAAIKGSAAGRAETAAAGTSSERVDLRGDLAARRRAGRDAAEITGADGTAEARLSNIDQL